MLCLVSLSIIIIPFVTSYLFFSASGVEVAEIRHFEKQQKSLAQSAADFRNSRLYSKDIPRESSKCTLPVYMFGFTTSSLIHQFTLCDKTCIP